MKTWLVGGTVVALLAAGFFLSATKRPALESRSAAPEVATVVPAATAHAELPVHIDRVVDVSNLDALLDPPPIPVSEPSTDAGPVVIRVGYEEPAAAKPSLGEVPPIPMSKNDD